MVVEVSPPRSGCLKIVLGAWRVLSADIGRKGNDWIIIYPSENIIIDERSLIQKLLSTYGEGKS